MLLFRHFDCPRFLLFCIIAINILVNYAINLKDERNITKEKLAIDELRNLVLPYIIEPFMKDDLHLLRWLRATQFNVKEAERKIIDDIQWRKEINITKLMKEDFTALFEDYPYVYTVGRQGQPTYIAYVGEWNIRTGVVTGQGPHILRYIIQICETCRRKIKDLQLEGKNVTGANWIIDLNGFTHATHGLVRTLEFAIIYEAHYTGMVDNVFLINAPPAIAATLDLMKNVANPVSQKALKVFGHGEMWQKAIYSVISPDKLPVEFGGTKPRSDFYS